MPKEEMNNTLLDPMHAAEINGVIHRDYMAHCLRWAFVGRLIGSSENIVDVGAGIGNLAETLYRHKMRPESYWAVEVHPPFIEKLQELSKKVNFPLVVLPVDVRNHAIPLKDQVADTTVC